MKDTLRGKRGSLKYRAIMRANSANTRARKYGVPGWLTTADVLALWERQPQCLHCGEGQGLDHIVEMSDGGPNTPENIQNLCISCNVKKSIAHRGMPVNHRQRSSQGRRRKLAVRDARYTGGVPSALTPEQVAVIQAAPMSVPHAHLARQVGTSVTTVRRVRQGEYHLLRKAA